MLARDADEAAARQVPVLRHATTTTITDAAPGATLLLAIAEPKLLLRLKAAGQVRLHDQAALSITPTGVMSVAIRGEGEVRADCTSYTMLSTDKI